MGQIEDRSNIDKIIKQLKGTEVPNLQPSNYKSDGSWSGNTLYIGQLAINNDSNKVWYAWNSGVTELTNQTPDLSGYYTSSQTNANFVSASTFATYTGITAPNLYVDIAGDTMTGNLTITPLSAATERIITTSGIGLLQNYLQTDVRWITNTTIISQLISENSWFNNTYSGTTTGAVEGQMYIGSKYLYIYQNSIFTRYNTSRDNTSYITGTTYTQLITDDIIINNCLSATTIQLLSASTFTDFKLTINNQKNVNLTIQPATIDTINNSVNMILGQYNSMTLYTNGNNLWVII